jgi:hypothetical protein
MPEAEKFDSLTVSLGTFTRHGWTRTGAAGRRVDIERCSPSVSHSKLKGDQVDIYVNEKWWADQPPAFVDDAPAFVGRFDFDRCHVDLFLPPQTFAQVWEAAAATDGVWRHMKLVYQDSERSVVGVTEATLREYMSGEVPELTFDPKTGRALRVPPRKDPVLAALQSVRTEIAWFARVWWIPAALIALLAVELIRR